MGRLKKPRQYKNVHNGGVAVRFLGAYIGIGRENV